MNVCVYLHILCGYTLWVSTRGFISLCLHVCPLDCDWWWIRFDAVIIIQHITVAVFTKQIWRFIPQARTHQIMKRLQVDSLQVLFVSTFSQVLQIDFWKHYTSAVPAALHVANILRCWVHRHRRSSASRCREFESVSQQTVTTSSRTIESHGRSTNKQIKTIIDDKKALRCSMRRSREATETSLLTRNSNTGLVSFMNYPSYQKLWCEK